MSANVSPSSPVPIPASELKLFQQKLEARAAVSSAAKVTSDKNLTSNVLGQTKQQQIVDTIAKNVVAATSLNSASATTISSAASNTNKAQVVTLASVAAPKTVSPVSSSLFNTGTYKYDSGNVTMSGATGVFTAGTFRDVTTINFGTRSVTSVYSGNFTTTGAANTGITNFSYTSAASYAKTVTTALSQQTNFQITNTGGNTTGAATAGSNLNQTQTLLYNGSSLTGAKDAATLAQQFDLATGKGNLVAAFGKFSTASGSAGTATLKLETSNYVGTTYNATNYGSTAGSISGTKANIVGTKQ
jgi:hypothetical protein